jgi:hypothetical protein
LTRFWHAAWQNRRIERLFGTLKRELDRIGVESRAALQTRLDGFNIWYNAVRPHRNLDGRTPLEAWEDIDPYQAPVKAIVWFEAWEGQLRGYYLRR